MKHTITLLTLLLSVALSAQNPHELLKQNPERYAGVFHSYEVPSTIVDTPAPSGYKPFYVSHYGRHGSRYLTSYAAMDTLCRILGTAADKGFLTEEGMLLFRDIKELREVHQGMLGILTQKGSKEHQGIAHRLFERVPSVFRQKDRNEVMAASSTIQRCIQSMANFNTQLKADVPGLDIKMYTGDRYMQYILKSSKKPRNSKLQKAIFDSVLLCSFNPNRAMKAWFNKPDEAARYFGPYDPAHFCFHLFSEACITQCLDENLHDIFSYFSDSELFQLWRCANMDHNNSMGFTIENNSRTDETGQAILRDIIEKADAAIRGNNRAADLRFGHDSGLLPLLNLIRIKGLEKPLNMTETSEENGAFIFEMMPMASNLQLIFYRNSKNEILVKLIRNDMETVIPELPTYRGPYYKWEELRKYFASLCGYKNLRLLYWNIQNGMWDGQDDNYDRFVSWVQEQNPDICVWCEAQSIYYSGTADNMKPEERFLVDGWNELASRYGHNYIYVGGHRDDYPQVITSKYPIENIERIVGAEPDSVVTHGAGWAQVDVNGKKINVVTLHTWPQKWGYRVNDKEASKGRNEGDLYRRMEIEYICNHTVLTHPDAAGEFWMMMGDHNARSRLDNDLYKYADNDTRLLVHDFILNNTPYIDVVKDFNPGKFLTSMHGQSRIDFVYLTPALNDKVVDARIVYDSYTEPVRDPKHLSNFWHPSDHRPIIVDFQL